MTAAKHKEGDRIKVEIGGKWHLATVIQAGKWSHFTGQSFPVYTVQFADGLEIRCGNNSTRAATKGQS